MAQGIFERVEKKFPMTWQQYEALLPIVEAHEVPDQYFEYTIGNIYYDTPDLLLIRRSLEQPKYKEKLRMRAYGTPGPSDNVFVELKKKYDGIVYKRRINMPLHEAEAYVNDGVPPTNKSQISSEIDYFLAYYNLQPAVYLAYDRRAYHECEGNELRITFDMNIRTRRDHLSLGDGTDGELLLGSDVVLMEVKSVGPYALWLCRALSDFHIYQQTFSKYGTWYKKILTERFGRAGNRPVVLQSGRII